MSLRSKSRASLHFELTPLVDMVFILLVFFMLGSAFLKPAIRMTLPVLAESISNTKPDPIYITLDAEGSIYVNQSKISFNQFVESFNALYQPGSDQNVVVRADQDVTYQRFMEVVFILKKQGVQDIGLEHDVKAR